METDMSLEYLSFRSNIPCRKIVLDDSEKVWTIYDGGPKTVRSPLICLPPVSGTADTFFQQALGLSAKGYRVISLSWPVYWSVNEWCEGFRKLLDFLQLDQVHLFGASLGGFLAQKFTEYTHRCPRVLSLVLCNSFTDTSVFQYGDSAPFLWMLPSMVLKKMVMGNFGGEKMMESVVADSVDFMVERLESLSQAELASRLTLNCGSSYVHVDKLQHYCITIIDVFDDCAIASPVSEDMYRSYPHASMAHLKNGGNFPYLSRCDENLYDLMFPFCRISNPITVITRAFWLLTIPIRHPPKAAVSMRFVSKVFFLSFGLPLFETVSDPKYGWIRRQLDETKK